MGHALNGSIQDALIRYHRMRGPAHAAGSSAPTTPASRRRRRSRRRCEAEGTSREEIGREAFVERVWEWREQYGSTIIEQFKRLGASCDYEHERFTLDEGYARAVLKVFVDLYDKGLIYRDNYMVNWDPGCRSAISDLEVEEREVTDTLYYDRLPAGRRRRVGHRRHGAAGDDARRHGRSPCTRTTSATRAWSGSTAILPLVGRRLHDHRRRLRQARVRHRLR